MLSKDELNNGRTFILKLWNAAGVSSQWVETLRGDTARRWYEIYRTSDWEALRAEAPAVFRNSVTESEADAAGKSGRCVFIHTPAVKVEELGNRDQADSGLAAGQHHGAGEAIGISQPLIHPVPEGDAKASGID